jgi:phenylpyruvate tautomerase PptA (4-oxalocrotonate tautomerase family)
MPIVRIDLFQGLEDERRQLLADAVHRAVVAAFGVVERDRYQIINEHAIGNLIAEDTGLDIPRTQDVVIVSVTSRPRSQEEKEAFYQLLCKELYDACQIASTDVIASITTNTDADWSFGRGEAQFLNGKL